MLPTESEKRNGIYNAIVGKKKTLHFALEEIILSQKKDIEKIENIYLIKKNSKNFYKM